MGPTNRALHRRGGEVALAAPDGDDRTVAHAVRQPVTDAGSAVVLRRAQDRARAGADQGAEYYISADNVAFIIVDHLQHYLLFCR